MKKKKNNWHSKLMFFKSLLNLTRIAAANTNKNFLKKNKNHSTLSRNFKNQRTC